MKNLLSSNLQNFRPYTVKSSNSDSPNDPGPENKRRNIVKMNANESPYPVSAVVLDQAFNSIQNSDVNFYPDTDSTELRQAIGEFLDFPMEQILVGNGSDEMIDLLLKTFVGKGDAVVSHDPTFVMYKILTEILGGKYYGVSPNEDLTINISTLIETANKVQAKVIFLCTPNNPTGQTISKDDVLRVLDETDGIVVIDEAYREFTEQDFLSFLGPSYPRLMILRTFSKAQGLAGVRGGYLLGSPEAVSYIHQIKPPYNLNVLTQKLLTAYLEYIKTPEGMALIRERIGEISRERDLLYTALQELPGFHPYPGSGNFICFTVRESGAQENLNPGADTFNDTLDVKLLEQGFQIKKFRYKNVPYYRISMGTPEENHEMIRVLQQLFTD